MQIKMKNTRRNSQHSAFFTRSQPQTSTIEFSKVEFTSKIFILETLKNKLFKSLQIKQDLLSLETSPKANPVSSLL